MSNFIVIKGAKVHNLKNIDAKIPKNKLVVITGLSGSGKSSLAFDTIYAEGHRRYVESLSSYARQFLGLMEKPDVELIEGLSPSIAIDQKNTSSNPRSTVGTITEIYDYIRLLFAKIGKPHCYKCGSPIESQTVQEIVDKIIEIGLRPPLPSRVLLLSPIVKGRKGEFETLFLSLQNKGFVRVRVDGKVYSLDLEINLDKNKKHDVEVIVDRILFDEKFTRDQTEFAELRQRVTDSVEACLRLSDGEIIVHLVEEGKDLFFSEKFCCTKCGDINYAKIEPNLFSFNSPKGACPVCNGLGEIKEIEPSLILNPELTILEGAIFPWSRGMENNWHLMMLEKLSEKLNFSLRVKVKKLSKEILNVILYGSKEYNFEGVIPYLYRKYEKTESDYVKREIERYMVVKTCTECNGTRLKKEALSVKILGKNIDEVSSLKIGELGRFIDTLKNSEEISDGQKKIIKPILKEIESRISFLMNVGISYLSINRSANTLSGGEIQRIRLASQIGSGLSGVIYVLDEPSIGLHQRDNIKLIKTLIELKNLGNSVIVVEHDEDTIRSSDWIIELGPGAGVNGGHIIHSGKLEELRNAEKSITYEYLSGKKIVGQRYLSDSSKNKSRLESSNRYIDIVGAKENNLKNINVSIPIGKFICVVGVSGSGKSTLINDILYNHLHNHFYDTRKKVGSCDSITGYGYIDKVINIDQSPIGRTPRSNPATYTGVFDEIRKLFASTNESKMRGYDAGRFSFNVKGGRCESCKGDGVIKVEMQFLPDVYVTCETCKGQRYNRETLEIQYRGKNIYEVLEMTIDEAIVFFKNIPKIYETLKLLSDVGLGYIRLGQPSNTLSGGESQRIKLASELKKKSTGRTLYILDEPTTGLHFADIDKLLDILHKLVDLGNTMIVIEHNLDVIKTADWIIELGPEAGDEGGEVVFTGTVSDIIQANTHTGIYLRKHLERRNEL